MAKINLQKSLYCLGFIFFAVAFVVAQAKAEDLKIPDLSGPIVDQAGILGEEEKQIIGAEINGVLAASGPQYQVWTLNSLEGISVEEASIRAVETWKLGRKGKDNGILLTIALNDRKTRLEIGRGLEGTITDLQAARILREILRPNMRISQPAVGIWQSLAAVHQLALKSDAVLQLSPLEQEQLGKFFTGASTGVPSKWKKSLPKGNKGINLPLPLVFVFLFGTILVLRALSAATGGGNRLGSRRGGIWIGHGGGFGGGSGGFSGGGWSGGGGGFSGGGSSGDW